MPVNKPVATPAIAIDTAETLRIDCYVRSAVPAPLTETIDAVIERLQRLCEHGSIAEYHISCWPPETVETNAPTRDELVAAFERWAEQHGHSLKPAFHRQRIPSSPLGLNEPYERVRVPVVALALYEAGTDEETDTETLCGVVPYTEQTSAGDKRTYTVEEWLAAVEPVGDEKKMHGCQVEQWSPMEGQQ
ncbi:HTH domain-containing protein [Natronorubrum sp. FCH18a]|uniref:HTH domain-containing protein n=1 Tax=Natronorubrum sp. FCH18a TaxID=3447018 RepID=UPI003F510BD0